MAKSKKVEPPLKRVLDWMNKQNLRAGDFGWNYVRVVLKDGSILIWADSIHKQVEVEGSGRWHAVFTEHHGYHAFHEDEVEDIVTLKPDLVGIKIDAQL